MGRNNKNRMHVDEKINPRESDGFRTEISGVKGALVEGNVTDPLKEATKSFAHFFNCHANPTP